MSDAIEIIETYREANRILVELWTAAAGSPTYIKSKWRTLDNAVSRLGRVAATAAGYPVDKPLVAVADE